MKKENVITKIIVPVVCAVIALAGGFIGGKAIEHNENLQQTSAINIEINNLLGTDVKESDEPTDLKKSTDTLMTAYEEINQELESQKRNTGDLQENIQQLQEKIDNLQHENTTLSDENSKLKDFLLKDNVYINNVDDLVVVKPTIDHLSDLYLMDSSQYEVLDGMRDLYGDTHSTSHKFHSHSTAFASFRLGEKYDIFNANIATNQETGENVRISIEVYVDDVLVKRIDDITRNTSLVALGPISVRNGKILTIKALAIEGDTYWAYCYITDDSLSVV